jgi:hypothetical protein
MQLENQGGPENVGSHWEKTILNNEVMTSSLTAERPAYSALTLALLKDTNWYTYVEETMA